MKVAKADSEDFEIVWSFVRPVEALLDGRSFFSSEDDWRDWKDDNEDKKLLTAIEEELKESDGTDWDGKADSRLIMYEFMKRRFREANSCGGFGRILTNAEVLIANCCDPNLDYLEFKPEILNAENNTRTKVEEWIAQNSDVNNEEVRKILEHIKEMKKDNDKNDGDSK